MRSKTADLDGRPLALKREVIVSRVEPDLSRQRAEEKHPPLNDSDCNQVVRLALCGGEVQSVQSRGVVDRRDVELPGGGADEAKVVIEKDHRLRSVEGIGGDLRKSVRCKSQDVP